MANIKPYLDQISNATYGEEVRGSIINALTKVNADNESYLSIKKEIVAINDSFQDKVHAAEHIKEELVTSTVEGNKSNDTLKATISIAKQKDSDLNISIQRGDTLISSLPRLISQADESKSELSNVVQDSQIKKSSLDESISVANQNYTNLTAANNAAVQTQSELTDSTENAKKVKQNVDSSTSTASTMKSNLDSSILLGEGTKHKLDESTLNAGNVQKQLNDIITTAGETKSVLDQSVNAANEAENLVNNATAAAVTAKNDLSAIISNAESKNTELTRTIASSVTSKAELDKSVNTANDIKANVDSSTSIADGILQSLDSENTAAASNIEELRSENFNSQEILAGVADLRAYLGLTDDDIVGVQVDYRNKTFKRIAGAVNLTAGADFDRFSMFGGRRRCNVADDGTIVAWHGDPDYKEDGTMGQVMVYQPKFYYLVCPVVYDPIETGIGYHLRKANYYVSEKPRTGFRLHPAFYDANGNEIDYFLTSAYEGSIWDADGNVYLLQDEQVMNAGGDKFSSISGARPASGSTQGLTRTAIEQMAQNRGANWHGDLIKQVSAEQMLMIIELGMMNLQTAIAQGVVTLPWETGSDKTSSYAAVTGSTSGIGNGTGRAERTTTYEGGVAKEYTVDGKTSVCWRGKENFWGNIWKFVYGINIWGNGKMGGGQPYICSDFNFAENKNSGNYEGAGFTATNVAGYISAMGYSTICDWLFIASECTGNSSLPVGDYTYITQNLNGYHIPRLGGNWSSGGYAGGFYWGLTDGVGFRYRYIGGRLVYIPTRDSAEYTAAIASWKEQMKKAA